MVEYNLTTDGDNSGSGTMRLFPDGKLVPDFIHQQTGIPIDKARENARNCAPRLCFERKNLIEYKYSNHAGLDDRRSVITTLSNIAAALCARLVFKPPCKVVSHGKASLLRVTFFEFFLIPVKTG